MSILATRAPPPWYLGGVVLAAVALLLACAAEFVLFGIGLELRPDVQWSLGTALVAALGAIAALRLRGALSLWLLAVSAAMVLQAPRLVARHQAELRTWARQQALRERRELLRQAERLPCTNGDIAVIDPGSGDGRGNRQLVVVPKHPASRPAYLAQSDPAPGGGRPSLAGIAAYIAQHGDCGNARYPSLLDATRALQRDYDRLHPPTSVAR